MTEFIQITAQYSNAVLVAIMPYVSDFAQKLKLPVASPLSPGQVLHLKCDPRKDKVGGLLTLTNGYQFTFLEGRVCVYRSPKSYFSLQDPDRIPEFFGIVKITQTEAVRIARQSAAQLGYPTNTFHTERPPKVTPPEKIGTNYVARYRLQWLDPNKPAATTTGAISPCLLDMEVDASSGQVQMLSFAHQATYRPSPTVDVSPPILHAAQATTNGLSGGTPTAAVTPAYTAALLQAIMPQLSDFAVKLQVEAAVPLTTNQVDWSRSICRTIDGQPLAQIYLTNGDRLNYQHGHVAAFYAHDAYRQFPDNGRIEDFLGRINMTTNQAIALCERTIKSLGYKPKLPKAWFGGRAYIGTNEFSRYVFYWRRPGLMTDFASAEVDVEARKIKSLFIDEPSLWRQPPKIDLPAEPPPAAPQPDKRTP